MRPLIRCLPVLRVLFCCFIALAGHSSIAQIKPPATPPQIVITHVTVINPATSSVSPDTTVVITGDRITSVSPGSTASASHSSNATVIDAKGLYLILSLIHI